MGCCPSNEAGDDEERQHLVNPHAADNDAAMPQEWVDKYRVFLDEKNRHSRHVDGPPPPPASENSPPPSSSSSVASSTSSTNTKFALDDEFKQRFQNWHPTPHHT